MGHKGRGGRGHVMIYMVHGKQTGTEGHRGPYMGSKG